VERALGTAAAQAWLAARRHHRYDVILSDGEHVGIPLACLLKQAGADVAHVMIGHRLSTPKKRPFFRIARVQTHIARVIVHASYQRQFAIQRLGFQPDQVCLVPYQVDVSFWRPQPIPEERLVSSAGLEHRDYQTLFRAVDGLDAAVVVGAASHWSRQPTTAFGTERPANVTVGSFDYAALRDLFARSSVVVVPLFDVDFQAGITTILEAMAMGKAVVVTHTVGQTDVVRDRRAAGRGMIAGRQPEGVPRANAGCAEAGIEPNGLYVPTGDPGTPSAC
jgi:glycosyltransferase involved in cell wall biosynthesis